MEVPMRIRTVVLLLALLTATVCAAPALAAKLVKGNSVVWVGLNGNRSHILTPPAALSSTGEENELGAHVAWSYFLSDAWAGVLSTNVDFGGSKFTPSSGTEDKFS